MEISQNPVARQQGEPETRQAVCANPSVFDAARTGAVVVKPTDFDAVNGIDLSAVAIDERSTQTPWGRRQMFWPRGLDPADPTTPTWVTYTAAPPATARTPASEPCPPTGGFTWWWLAVVLVWAMVALVACRRS
jgi:hypothetical protein